MVAGVFRDFFLETSISISSLLPFSVGLCNFYIFEKTVLAWVIAQEKNLFLVFSSLVCDVQCWSWGWESPALMLGRCAVMEMNKRGFENMRGEELYNQ